MPNTPFKHQRRKTCRPPRYDRVQEMAALHLGFSPYQLWYGFTVLEEEPNPGCKRWLLDLPVLLPYFRPYDLRRYRTTLEEVLELYESYSIIRPQSTQSVVIEDPAVAEARLRAAMEEVLGSHEGPTSTPSLAERKSTDSPGDEADLTVGRAPLEEAEEPEEKSGGQDDQEPLSDDMRAKREWHLMEERMYRGDVQGHFLIRLVSAIGLVLPPHLQRWFRLGQTIGRCLGYLTENEHDPDVDLRQEILIVIAGTDFEGEEIVPDLSYGAYQRSRGRDDGPKSPEYFTWVYERLGELVADFDQYLANDPAVVLSPENNALWILGVYVVLTQSESVVLSRIAESKDDVVKRELLWAGKDPRKADQYVQAIINKIVSALQEERSVYYLGNRKTTREWLRKEFLVSVSEIGWRRGRLAKRMVTKQAGKRF